MSTSKPVEWVSALIERFADQVSDCLERAFLYFPILVADQMWRIDKSNALEFRAEQRMFDCSQSIQVFVGDQRFYRYSQKYRQYGKFCAWHTDISIDCFSLHRA